MWQLLTIKLGQNTQRRKHIVITKDLEHLKPLRGDEPLPRDSEYLGADDIDQKVEPVLTIKNLYRGKVTLSRGKEVKNVLTFAEENVPGIVGEVRPLIVNALEGKKIQLYIEHGVRNPSNGELTDGIRIRDKKPAGEGAKPKAAVKCADCGKEIAGSGNFSAEQIAAGSKQKYGKCLCMDCAQKAKAELEKLNEAQKAQMQAGLETEPQDDLAAQLMADAD